MSDKLCDDHKEQRGKLQQRCSAFLFLSAFLILVSILLVWAILQPRKPVLTLEDATIFNLNVSSSSSIISTTIQVSVRARNPNSHIGVYYESLAAYAAYRSQQITDFTLIPPVFQAPKEVNVWSPFLYGLDVPVAPYNGAALGEDKSNGDVAFVVRINGRVKWRVGSIVTGRYHLHVTCPASIPVRTAGKNAGTGIKYQLSERCSVNV